MNVAKGKVIVNLDKCYDHFEEAYQILKKTGTINQVIFKGEVSVVQLKKDYGNYLDKVLFMPVINLANTDAESVLSNYKKEFMPIAFELVFPEINEKVYAAFDSIHKWDSKIWVNSLWSSLNGGYEDDVAVKNPESIYGWYNKNNIKIIQTDRPEMLLNYLRKHKLHH